MTVNNLDVKVYPIDEPKGSTFAFASVAIEDLGAIRGVRVVNGEKGLFTSMPQSQDNEGRYHDTAFPLNGELRKTIDKAVIDEYYNQANIDPLLRGYDDTIRPEPTAKRACDVKLDVKIYPISKPKGDTLAFASIGMDDKMAIRGIRIVNSEKGAFVTMPQSKDKEGRSHDIAFPLSGELRKEISRAVLKAYKQITAELKQEVKQSIGERLAEGKEKAALRAVEVPLQQMAAKKSPGLGD